MVWTHAHDYGKACYWHESYWEGGRMSSAAVATTRRHDHRLGRSLEPPSTQLRLLIDRTKQIRCHALMAAEESVGIGPGQGAQRLIEVWPPLDATSIRSFLPSC